MRAGQSVRERLSRPLDLRRRVSAVHRAEQCVRRERELEQTRAVLEVALHLLWQTSIGYEGDSVSARLTFLNQQKAEIMSVAR